MKICVQCLLAGLLLVDLVSAATITVRKDGTGDYSILQQALNASADGDSILIGPGEYTEMPWVRIPAWSWDVRSCGYITADNLTIIGAGANQTLIGSTVYSANNSLFSPKVLVYTGRGELHVQDVTLRNCYTGAYVAGALYMDRCVVDNNALGVSWQATGSGGWIKDTMLRAASPLDPVGADVISSGGGSNMLMECCRSEGVETIIEGIQGMAISDCEFLDDIVGISVNDNARVHVNRTAITNMSSYGIMFSLGADGLVEIQDSDISGSKSAFDTGANATNGQFVVFGSTLRGGSTAVIYAHYRPGPCVINGCDLIKGSGPIVQCGPSYTTVTHDMTNNYWGTTNEADIQTWIIDHTDNANIPATVLYRPFDGQPVPTEATSWGDLKALFR